MDSMRTKTDVLVELEEIIMQSIYVITMILVACHYHLNYSRRRSIGKYSMSERIEDQIKHLDRLVHFSDTWCVDNLRMNRNAFAKLCYLLRVNGGLADSRHVRVEEKVAMFVNILAHHHKNCTVKFNFMRSGQTVSRYFHAVLQALLRLHSQLLVNPQPVPQDCNDPRWKWFKGCLGALDGTYIKVKVPEIDKPRYRTRKGEIATNVLGVCDRNMRFIYVLPGWEGSAADGRVLRDAISRADGLKVPIDMEPPSIGQIKGKGKKTDKSRRVWTTREEDVLIGALKELCITGWKCDNGTFRSGYTTVLEKAMLKVFPSSDLKATPHIESKIKMWKKNYGSLASMLGKSGFGWNYVDHMITVDSDDVWENYVKIDLDAKSMRFKSWPYYEDWVEIFGKDRATGQHAEGINDAVNAMEKEKDGEESNYVEGLEDINDISNAQDQVTPSSSKQVKDGNKDRAKKRKLRSEDENSGLAAVAEALGKFTEKTEARLGMIAERIGYEHDMSSARREVYATLAPMTWLSKQEKLRVASRIISDHQHLDLFFSLPDEDKPDMYRQMRRKEQDRLARMDVDHKKRKEISEFHMRREERLKAAEERTAKKRMKRQKKKQRKKEKRNKVNAGGEDHEKDESSDDDADSENNEVDN